MTLNCTLQNIFFKQVFQRKSLVIKMMNVGGWVAGRAGVNYSFPGQLVGWLGFNRPLRQYFNLYRAVSQRERGWSGGAMVLGELPVPGRPTYLDKSSARTYCAYSGCGCGLFGHFYPRLSFLFSFSLSLGDGPI